MHFGLRSCLGVLICTGVAVFLSIYLNDGREIRLAAPVICLLVLICTASYCGRMSGLIGSLIASVVLALCLFPPFGSLAIQEPAARIVMTLCQLCAIAVVVCYPPDPGSKLALRNPSS